MAASPKEKFEAAVKVIHSLPKNGSFQPSHALMLKFYAYYKQANQGPCDIARPAFWDVVGKAKWDAWNTLGDMPREEAMTSYVDELKKVLAKHYPNGYNREEIVEAMPHTAMVQDFVQKLDNFYELVDSKQAAPKLNGSVPNGKGDHSGSEEDEIARSFQGQPEGERSQEAEILTAGTKPLKLHASQDNDDVSDKDDDVIENDVMTSQSTPVKTASEGNFNADEGRVNGRHMEPQSTASNSPQSSRPHDSDSEGEEFCDTSDSPHSQQRLDIEDAEQSAATDHTYSRSAGDSFQAPSIDFPRNDDSRDYFAARNSSSTAMFPGQSLAEGFMSPPLLTDRNQSTVFTDQSFGEFSDRDWRQGLWMGKSARGAGEAQPGAATGLPSAGSGAALAGQAPGASPRTPSASGRQHLQAAGSGGGGGGEDGNPPQYRPEVTQQIAVALVRLQQDMNSVLSRLNTLEALTVQQTQINRRSRENSGSSGDSRTVPWWWPFSQSQTRTWFFILVWPFLVHWLIAFISKRRNRRR